MTATVENIKLIAEYLNNFPDSIVRRWELCLFNNLCKNKYSELGYQWEFENTQLLTELESQELFRTAKKYIQSHIDIKLTGFTIK